MQASPGKTASMRVPRPHFLSGLHHRIARDPERGSGWVGCVSRDSLPGQVAPAAGLEADDDVGDLQVPLLLQVGQHAGLEKDLALAHMVQVALELQGFDPEEESRLLTTGHPGHHRALEQGQGQGRAWSLAWPLLCGQPPPGAGRMGLRGRRRGQVGVSRGQVTGKSRTEIQNLGPVGTLPAGVCAHVHFLQGWQ